ncbi:hypothetical protein BCY84_11540 [Trypanosoma cruzi cruzi]|nr:hypothetical protein TcBrA4_0045570 [Trypanosoma cruzi]PBJ75141.1 hypothetical protein BCY84_11540 [Trypanosoma cruzi cruzi]PWU91435.1 hypothetical protein C4B63_43g180 [Trypanosoma cruzi]
MFPWFMIAHTIVFTVLLLVTVVPPLYIYNPEEHPGESLGPNPAGGIFPDSPPNHWVRQQLYILFVLPSCAFLNSLFVYFTYYRHLRHVQFRAELSSVAHANLRTAAMIVAEEQQGVECNVENAVGGSRSGGGVTNRSLLALRPFCSKSSINSTALYARRHIRPEGLSLHMYSTSPWFPELRELQKVVEAQFLRPAEKTREVVFSCLHKDVLVPFEKRMNLQEGSMANAIRFLSDRESKCVTEPGMRVYLTEVELKRRRSFNNESILRSEPSEDLF